MIKIYEKDELTKKERVLRTLCHQSVDRVAIHDQFQAADIYRSIN